MSKGKRELLLRMYKEMLFIRRVEEKIADCYGEQEMRCPVHLSIGQEATAVGACILLSKKDVIYSTHRCHAHYLAKGGNLPKMIAELYGKSTGCCGGKAGSMHLLDPSCGMMGTSAVVGATIPIAMGHSWSFLLDRKKNVVIVFFGDSAVEQGTFHESLNLAALHEMPILFLCENNGYSTQTPMEERQPDIAIAAKAKAHGIPGVTIDGNDVYEVYQATLKGLQRIQRGKGPSLIECITYRYREHVGPNYDWDMGYRTKAEVESWMKRCPVKRLKNRLLKEGIATKGFLEDVVLEIDDAIQQAFLFAKQSPYPDLQEIERGIGL